MASGNKVYQMVTDRILEEMEKGVIPWHKAWFGKSSSAINYVTRKSYSLLNQLLLDKEGEWLSFKQIQDLNGHIKKGEKSSYVVFWNWLYFDKDGNKVEKDSENVCDKVPYLRYYNVWHIDQCEGIKSKCVLPDNVELHPVDEAEKVIGAYVTRENLKFSNTSETSDAYYSPSNDEVVIPMISQYKEVAEYYSTAFHELVHSTGHEKRLNRKGFSDRAAFGSNDYGCEELVAECGSAMICNQVGIDCAKAFRNQVAYLQSWIKAIKGDSKLICVAAAQAEKAVRYIIGNNENN